MGQYFKIVFLSDNGEFIRAYISPRSYDGGSKLMEHSWIGSAVLKIVEMLLSPQGMFYKSRIVWAGDYAEPEKNYVASDDDGTGNLYYITDNYPCKELTRYNLTHPVSPDFDPYIADLRYIANHTKRLYVDKHRSDDKETDFIIHPLPLLTYDGEQAYYGSNEQLCCTWARDVISMETQAPEEYTELICNFK